MKITRKGDTFTVDIAAVDFIDPDLGFRDAIMTAVRGELDGWEELHKGSSSINIRMTGYISATVGASIETDRHAEREYHQQQKEGL